MGMAAVKRTPVYFISHGGPNLMYDSSHPAYSKLAKIGRGITSQAPKAVVVVSGHWQAARENEVEVNVAPSTELIYDFYGFPGQYYKEKYPHKGDPQLAQRIITLLQSHNIAARPVERGLDHGVWVPFKVAFDPDTNPLNIPIVQVSLFATEDARQHIALGQALSGLREQGVVIIASGMAVHNLRDMRFGMGPGTAPRPYTVSFDKALQEAAEASVETRADAMAQLVQRKDARQAHPSFDHLLPVHVAAGAAGEDLGKRTWTSLEGA